MRIGITEILLIIVLALILFGGAKISGLGKALGKSIKDFRNEIKSDVKEPADSGDTSGDDKKA
jgi:sec-independent protein translocase protein TatA